MVEVPSLVMPEPRSDRQVILAIALTLILVFGLILGSVSRNQERQARCAGARRRSQGVTIGI